MTRRIAVLGDPHLGRAFVHGVPLARRGEREAMVWKQFEESLNLSDPLAEFHLCLGDLFDKAVVSYDVINRAAQLYLEAARKYPNVTFLIVKGNHDWQRDLDRISAFDLFNSIVQQQENIQVVDLFYQVDNDFAVFAWHPTISAADMVEKCGGKYLVAYGHWDVEGYGDHNPNLIPLKELAAHGVKCAFTGHIHKEQYFHDADSGVDVHVWGSMQPYAHGEEINTDLYVTLTLDELKNTNLDLRHRSVRVILNDGETLDDEVDCLQLTIKRVGEDDSPIETVSLGDFDMMSLFVRAFAEAGVSEKITSTMVAKYHETRLSDGI